MLARVIPFDTSFDAFGATYVVPDALAESVFVGMPVLVPWGKDTREGIIAEWSDKPADSSDIPLKSITAKMAEVPWSTPEWVSVASLVARHNFLPIHTVFALGLPADLRRRFAKKGACVFAQPGRRPAGQESLVVPKDRAEVFGEVARRLMEKGKKHAVLFPDDAMLADFFRAHPEAEGQTVISKNKDTESVRAKIFAACAEAKRSFAGPRSRLTWPLAGYDALVVVEDALCPHLTVSRRPVWYRDFASAWQTAGLDVEVVASVPLPDTLARLLAARHVQFF